MKFKMTILLGMTSLSCYASDDVWSGCYAGASASHLETDNQWTTTSFNDEAMNDNAGSANADETSIGVQFGCDFLETEKSVWGLKVMASDADLYSEHVYTQNPPRPSNLVSYETEDVISFVGRYGFKVSDSGLLYGQLGYVQSDNKYQDNDPLVNPAFHYEQSADRDGVLWGIGYEHQFMNHVSFFAEYSFTDFGKEKIYLIDTGTFNVSDYQAKIDQDLSQFNLGVNYRF
ncbi:outer membrane protein [Marinicella rhabdoformis]|uniref:outer membrane protein n=1 Tax=Marinicella rhabdoformis TaxID=2580566 RepID=UPI0012AECF90|nr:outer membrane beta-barrel protein [Marinicella rhabdoformis]